MKLSQFRQLVDEEFGPSFAAVILADTRLTAKSDKTPLELMASGDDLKEVWLELCAHLGVPKERWNGKTKTKQHAEN